MAAYTSSDWFHDFVAVHAQTLVFPRGKTKFLCASDGSVGTSPSTGSVLIGVGPVANGALRRCELGLFVQIREPAAISVIDLDEVAS